MTEIFLHAAEQGRTGRRAAEAPARWILPAVRGGRRWTQTRSLVAFGRHPNVAATLVVGGSRPQVESIAAAIGEAGKPVEALILDDCDHDAVTVTERGIRAAARLVRDCSKQRRETFGLERLFLALECGRSDPSSGLVANPLVGKVVDVLIAAGGRAVLGETIEWLGAEHLLIARAADPAVGAAIRDAVLRRERMAVDAGIDLVGNNPGPTNVAAGLSTIEEKSLGAIAKGGSSPIRGVVGMPRCAQPPPAWRPISRPRRHREAREAGAAGSGS
jgi:altronate dehydratase large subunit